MSKRMGSKSQESATTDPVTHIAETVESLKERVERLEQTVFGREEHAAQIVPTLDFDFSGLTYLESLKSTIDMCLAILDYIFDKNPNHPGLTPDEIESLFRERFGLPIPLTTISVAFHRAAGTLVTRTKVPGSPIRYRYRILPKGQAAIREKIDQLNKT